MIMSRMEAIILTDKFIASLTKKQAVDIMGKDASIERVKKFAWDMGVGGHYYDEKLTVFCTDIIVIERVKKFAWDMGVGGYYYDEKLTVFCTDIIVYNIVLKYLEKDDLNNQNK